MDFKKQNLNPVQIESIPDEHDESRAFEPSFWWNNRRYYIGDFARCHNNPWIGCADFPEYIHGIETDNYYHPLFIEVIGGEYVNIYEEV